MKWILFSALAVMFVVTGVAQAASTNQIQNPNYADGFAHWTQTEGQWKAVKAPAARTRLADGASSEICADAFPVRAGKLSLGVNVKASTTASALDPGSGYAVFIVRELDAQKKRITDLASPITDNAPPQVWYARAWALTIAPGSVAYVQVCARAIAFDGKNFTVALTHWSATQ